MGLSECRDRNFKNTQCLLFFLKSWFKLTNSLESQLNWISGDWALLCPVGGAGWETNVAQSWPARPSDASPPPTTRGQKALRTSVPSPGQSLCPSLEEIRPRHMGIQLVATGRSCKLWNSKLQLRIRIPEESEKCESQASPVTQCFISVSVGGALELLLVKAPR